jgi:hypothetical protein
VDSGQVCLLPVADLIGVEDTFIAGIDGPLTHAIYNAFILAAPRHPILKRVLDICVERIQTRSYSPEGCLWLTGPIALGDAVNDILGRPRGTPFAEKVYKSPGGAIRVIRHTMPDPGRKEYLQSGRKRFSLYKYPGYQKDKKLWQKGEDYGVLWHQRRVYATPTNLN